MRHSVQLSQKLFTTGFWKSFLSDPERASRNYKSISSRWISEALLNVNLFSVFRNGMRQHHYLSPKFALDLLFVCVCFFVSVFLNFVFVFVFVCSFVFICLNICYICCAWGFICILLLFVAFVAYKLIHVFTIKNKGEHKKHIFQW